MGSLAHSREWPSGSRFRPLLRGGPRRRKLKMWFQALEFAVSCTVAKYIFIFCCRRKMSRSPYSSKKRTVLSLSRLNAPCADSRNTRHRAPFSLPMPAQTPIIVRAGLAIAAATTVFLERAAEEQRSIFYNAVAAELRMNELPKH